MKFLCEVEVQLFQLLYFTCILQYTLTIMPSLVVINLITGALRLGNFSCSLVPISIHSNQLAVSKKCKTFRPKFWKIQFILMILLTLSQLNFYSQFAGNSKVVDLLFHINMLSLELGNTALLFMFQGNTIEICQFLNQIFAKHHGLIPTCNTKTCYHNNRLVKRDRFAIFLIYICSSLTGLYWVILPITLYTFPKLIHTNFSSESDLTGVQSFWNLVNKIAHFYMPFLFGILSGAATFVGIVALTEIKVNLHQLINLAKKSRNIESNKLRKSVCVYYRQIQLLVMISNKCFQTHFWPAVMFCGSFALISFLYPLLAYASALPAMFQVGFTAFAIVLGFVSVFLLDQCTNPIVLSKRVKSVAMQWGNTGYFNKFFQSCPPIVLKVGELHVMDKGRVTAFIRFILQRTAFFVLKYKSESRIV